MKPAAPSSCNSATRTVPPRITRLNRSCGSGPLSKKVRKGADMGSIATACWVRDAASDRYREIELEVRGDWSYMNTAPAAAELTRWLASYLRPSGNRR